MSVDEKAADLFIVDNSISDWTGIRYLEEWCSIAKGFDIATGYFEIGSLLALDGKWQDLEKVRILMGEEVTQRTKKAIYDAIEKKAKERLDANLENEKRDNPFLTGVPAIIDGIKAGKIEIRAYDKDKFHAKAYITHAKMEVVGSQALVGSSNFTKPGLTQNVELNVKISSSREVAQLQQWFEAHWKDATPVEDAVLSTVDRHSRDYSPFEVYAKSLYEYFHGHELTASEWDETESKMFPVLDRYQKEAYWALMKIAKQHGGAFLCDGVGLGKTFVGLMLLERLILREGKKVVLFAPKTAKEGVWEPHLREWLSHVGGIGGSVDFSNLAVFSHTDLNRKGDFPDRFQRLTEMADAVLIDEAHHFRNPGRKADPAKNIEPSRYRKLFDIMDRSDRDKMLFMLTATPINNRLSDFRHMAELFTRRDEAYFAQTLGVNNLRSHFIKLEKELKKQVDDEDMVDTSDHLAEANEILSTSPIVQQLVVQRSRSYAKESQIQETGNSASFPKRSNPKVAEYSIKKTYGKLLEKIDSAFQKKNPLFTLPMYYPLAWYSGSDDGIDPVEQNRQKQVIGLIRTNFLKRFESSVAAFERSCERLMQKLMAFVEVNQETEAKKKLFQRWKDQHATVINQTSERQLEIWGEEPDESDEDLVPEEMLQSIEKLDRDEFRVDEMIAETLLDLDQITAFLSEIGTFTVKHDDKIQKLTRLLKSKDLVDKKVIIFTEFADTARYLRNHLADSGIKNIYQVDSGTKENRAEIIKRFAPYYNGSSSKELSEEQSSEIQVLISTDVLSEGLNLQDAVRLINYDIHWNPVRLMQRIGRVDRRMNPKVEEKLVEDHPSLENVRGKIVFWNFLPPDELNDILSLYRVVTGKLLVISHTLGIEGGKLLRPEDELAPLKHFNDAYEGRKTNTEKMRLEYQRLLKDDPLLEERLAGFPSQVFSGRKKIKDGVTALFFCYRLPALDKEAGQFSMEAGIAKWYLYDVATEAICEESTEIIEHIRSKPNTVRLCKISETTLMNVRKNIEKHIKNTYLKRVNAPIGVNPLLQCWMELNEK